MASGPFTGKRHEDRKGRYCYMGRHGSRGRSGGGRFIPIVVLALIFGRPAIRLALRIARAIFRSVTTGISLGADRLFDRSSILGSIAIGVIIGLVFYYRRIRKQDKEADEAENEDIDEEEEPEAPFCPPIMTTSESAGTDDDYVPPMYHTSGN